MMPARLTVVRHAEASCDGVCYGRADVSVKLSPQAALRQVTWPAVATVWSSPSPRCRDLAAAVAAQQRASLRVDERLYEMDFGAWEGRAWRDISEDELTPWMSDWQNAAPPGGETTSQLTARVAAWHEELATPPHRHLLVAHAGVVRALWVVHEEMMWPDAMERAVPHLEPIELR